MQSLENQLEEIKTFIDRENKLVAKVSKSDSYWQLHHSLTVVDKINDALAASRPLDYRPSSSIWKSIIMTLGFIPRGKGKAPKHTIATSPVEQPELLLLYESAYGKVRSYKELHDKACFKHPMFGWLNKKETYRFLQIHTHHHLKIVRDIYNTA